MKKIERTPTPGHRLRYKRELRRRFRCEGAVEKICLLSELQALAKGRSESWRTYDNKQALTGGPLVEALLEALLNQNQEVPSRIAKTLLFTANLRQKILKREAVFTKRERIFFHLLQCFGEIDPSCLLTERYTRLQNLLDILRGKVSDAAIKLDDALTEVDEEFSKLAVS